MLNLTSISLLHSLKAKYSKELLKYAVLRKINVDELIGISDEDPFTILEGSIRNKAQLLTDAKINNNVQLMEAIHMAHLFSAFWMGDFDRAMEPVCIDDGMYIIIVLSSQCIYLTKHDCYIFVTIDQSNIISSIIKNG